MMSFIDTHAHLYLDEFKADIETVIANAVSEGVTEIYLPNISSHTIAPMNALVYAYPSICYPMIGLHPCEVKENYKEELAIIADQAATNKYIAIGEIGMDLYWDKSFLREQQAAFIFQIKLAKKAGLPLAIHVRNAFDEVLEILDDHNDENLRGVVHCFTGTRIQAQHIIDYGGFALGIGGCVTFKNGGLDLIIPDLSIDHLILETDAPYLTPTPFRGKRNESRHIPLIADKIAQLKGMKIEDVALITTKNARELFGR